jgi:Protein of unknown function (DUF1566)
LTFTTAVLTACGNGSTDPVPVSGEASGLDAIESASPCQAPPYPKTGYSLVFKACSAANVAEYYAKDECVRDNATGLIWQGQTAAGTGLRANDQKKSNYDNTNTKQVAANLALPNRGNLQFNFVYPTQGQIDAITNSIGFKNAVNATKLCGSSEWRIPTITELATLIQYQKASPPLIDTDWFLNVPKSVAFYLSSSPDVRFYTIYGDGFSRYIEYWNGVEYINYRSTFENHSGSLFLVRLVR